MSRWFRMSKFGNSPSMPHAWHQKQGLTKIAVATWPLRSPSCPQLKSSNRFLQRHSPDPGWWLAIATNRCVQVGHNLLAKVCPGVFRLATTYHTELVDSSKKLLSADCVAPTTISPRPPGFVCPQTGPVLVTDACRSAHLLAPAPTRLAPPPWRMVGAGEGCTARGGARQWWPRRILRLTFSGPAWLS